MGNLDFNSCLPSDSEVASVKHRAAAKSCNGAPKPGTPKPAKNSQPAQPAKPADPAEKFRIYLPNRQGCTVKFHRSEPRHRTTSKKTTTYKLERGTGPIVISPNSQSSDPSSIPEPKSPSSPEIISTNGAPAGDSKEKETKKKQQNGSTTPTAPAAVELSSTPASSLGAADASESGGEVQKVSPSPIEEVTGPTMAPSATGGAKKKKKKKKKKSTAA